MRWNRLQDIGLDDKQIKDFLLSGNQKVGDMMGIAMAPKDAKAWFGKVPPDLSVIVARAHLVRATSAPTICTRCCAATTATRVRPPGWNNVVYPNIGMPHVLWQRQGAREVTITRVFHDATARAAASTCGKSPIYDANGAANVTRTDVPGHPGRDHRVRPSSRSMRRPPHSYDSDMADLVAYLAYMTEPVKVEPRPHRRLGAAVPWPVHGRRVAPERGVLERHPLKARARTRAGTA